MASSEFELIYRYLAAYGSGPSVALGVGDDAAVLTPRPGEAIVVSTDAQLEGVHFPEFSLPEAIAYRVVACAASDLAAMAATPLAMTLSLTLPDSDELWLHGFSQGLGRVCNDLKLPLVGGDLTRGALNLAVTVIGSAPMNHWRLRGSAQLGDCLCVSGTLGDAAAALALMQGDEELRDLPHEQQLWLESRFYQPLARFDLTPWLRANAHACIDVSDGLIADLGHIADASGVALEVDAQRLPLSSVTSSLSSGRGLAWALAGGDDYELAFTCPDNAHLPDDVTVIGKVVVGSGVRISGIDSTQLKGLGYDHFKSS